MKQQLQTRSAREFSENGNSCFINPTIATHKLWVIIV